MLAITYKINRISLRLTINKRNIFLYANCFDLYYANSPEDLAIKTMLKALLSRVRDPDEGVSE